MKKKKTMAEDRGETFGEKCRNATLPSDFLVHLISQSPSYLLIQQIAGNKRESCWRKGREKANHRNFTARGLGV